VEQEIIVLGDIQTNIKDIPFYGKAERIVEGLFHSLRNKKKVSLKVINTKLTFKYIIKRNERRKA